MKIINSMRRAIVTSFYTIMMSWQGNQYVVNRKTFHVQFCCPTCHHESLFVAEITEQGPWHTICEGCNNSLRLSI